MNNASLTQQQVINYLHDTVRELMTVQLLVITQTNCGQPISDESVKEMERIYKSVATDLEYLFPTPQPFTPISADFNLTFRTKAND